MISFQFVFYLNIWLRKKSYLEHLCQNIYSLKIFRHLKPCTVCTLKTSFGSSKPPPCIFVIKSPKSYIHRISSGTLIHKRPSRAVRKAFSRSAVQYSNLLNISRSSLQRSIVNDAKYYFKKA